MLTHWVNVQVGDYYKKIISYKPNLRWALKRWRKKFCLGVKVYMKALVRNQIKKRDVSFNNIQVIKLEVIVIPN